MSRGPMPAGFWAFHYMELVLTVGHMAWVEKRVERYNKK